MPFYEYKTIPAPRKGEKAKGVKSIEARFAQAMQTILNAQAAYGWEYQRSETLPVEHRVGLASKSVSQHSILIFRREQEVDISDAVITPTIAATRPAEAASNDIFEAAEEILEDIRQNTEATSQTPDFKINGLRATRD